MSDMAGSRTATGQPAAAEANGTSSGQAILALEGIVFGYGGGAPLFNGLDFSLAAEEQFGLYGPNGSGKTTLLRLMTGLEVPSGGRVLFHGEPADNRRALRRLRCGVGFVLQNSDDQLFLPTVLEDVAFGPLNLGLGKRQARERALATLEELGLAGLAGRATHRLSGGEKKLAAIASVLAMRPEALLLDEPTVFLDDGAKERITDILQRQNTARVVVSHDRDFLARTTSALVGLQDGGLVSLL